MGYTHYWTQSRSFTKAEWQTMRVAALQIMGGAEARGIFLGDAQGKTWSGDELFSNDSFCFNGANDESYETFCVRRKMRGASYDGEDMSEGAFGCCKTGFLGIRPYDAVVVSILRMMRQVAPGAIDISSDGGEAAFAEAPFVTDAKAPPPEPKGRPLLTTLTVVSLVVGITATALEIAGYFV